MSKATYNILIVEDNETMREGMVRVVEKIGHRAAPCADAEAALVQLNKQAFHLMVSDYKLPGMDGLQLLGKVTQMFPDMAVLIITAYGTIELAVEAMQKGATDFITKPFSPEELTLKIAKILERIREKEEYERVSEENLYLRQQLADQHNFGKIVGNAPAMQTIYRTIEKVAQGDSSVIIYGESGTGKELVAHAIHHASPRRERAFVRVNCGALAEGVLESELFGHERGAFTGAVKRKKGRFELADGGSIFLDEIGDIPLATQVKLLRVLQDREFERVGGEETLTVDVRVIAATNKNLQDEIGKGNFREDLYYRLHIIPIHLPPLRKRKEDIPLLIEHFITKVGHQLNMPNIKIENTAVRQLMEYDWPGNIRELENVLERAAVLCENARITASELPFFGQEEMTSLDVGSRDRLDLTQSLEKLERQLIEQALEESAGVKTEAARILGIKTSALYYKLEKYDLS